MKQSVKPALGGIVAALSLALMISVAIVPFLTYALPAVAGALIGFVVIEIGKKWATGVYATVAILGFILVPDKEVAVMYLAFFGYYPILKEILEKLPKALAIVLKILLFNSTIFASYVALVKLFGISIDEIDTYGKVAIPMLLGLGTLAFLLYDFALTKFAAVYRIKWRKHFKRYFK